MPSFLASIRTSTPYGKDVQYTVSSSFAPARLSIPNNNVCTNKNPIYQKLNPVVTTRVPRYQTSLPFCHYLVLLMIVYRIRTCTYLYKYVTMDRALTLDQKLF